MNSVGGRTLLSLCDVEIGLCSTLTYVNGCIALCQYCVAGLTLYMQPCAKQNCRVCNFDISVWICYHAMTPKGGMCKTRVYLAVCIKPTTSSNTCYTIIVNDNTPHLDLLWCDQPFTSLKYFHLKLLHSNVMTIVEPLSLLWCTNFTVYQQLTEPHGSENASSCRCDR